MGVFDGILGDDEDQEKEEMRENIDKIREKVQEGQEPRPPAGREGPEPPVAPGEIGMDEGGMERRGGDRQRQPPAGQPEPFEEESLEPEEPSRPPRENRQRERSEGRQEGPTHDDVPEPPELKELDVPDIEKGPLFITVDKFRGALHAISDMRRVAREMEEYIGSMEGTLQEDRDTEQGIRQILDEAEEDTEDLKDIVSP